MYCRKCGALVEEGNEFCPTCGSRLGVAPGQNRPQQPGSDAAIGVPGAFAAPPPVMSTEHPGSANRPLIKPGKERVFGILVIILAVLGAILTVFGTSTLGFLALFLSLPAPAALLLAGIFGRQLVERCNRVGLLGEHVSGLAAPDRIAGILLILSTVVTYASSILQLGYYYGAIGMLLPVLPQVILVGIPVVLYFRSARLAKSVQELSSVTFSASAIILGVYLLCILGSLLILPQLTMLGAVFLMVFFIMRGTFWCRAAGSVSRGPKPQQAGQFATTPLTGGAKFGYFALGFFLGVIGILVAWLVNKDNPGVSKVAIKFSVIGFVSTTALVLIAVAILFILVWVVA